MKTTNSSEAPGSECEQAPWAHLPAEEQRAIQIALAKGIAQWLRDEVAARKALATGPTVACRKEEP